MVNWNNRDNIMFSFVSKPDNILNKNWVPDSVLQLLLEQISVWSTESGLEFLASKAF